MQEFPDAQKRTVVLYQSRRLATKQGAGERMYGIWLLILFGVLPAALGAAIAFILSRDEKPDKKVMLLGAVAGAVVGLIAGVLLARL